MRASLLLWWSLGLFNSLDACRGLQIVRGAWPQFPAALRGAGDQRVKRDWERWKGPGTVAQLR